MGDISQSARLVNKSVWSCFLSCTYNYFEQLETLICCFEDHGWLAWTALLALNEQKPNLW